MTKCGIKCLTIQIGSKIVAIGTLMNNKQNLISKTVGNVQTRKNVIYAQTDIILRIKNASHARQAVWNVQLLKSAINAMMEWMETLAHAALDGLEQLRDTSSTVYFFCFLFFFFSFLFAKIEKELVAERGE
jgi:hypothetical protein